VHKDDIWDYNNTVVSGSEARSSADIKGKLVDPQIEGEGTSKSIAMGSSVQVLGKIKVENPALERLKKEVATAKKAESKALQELPSLIVLKRTINEEGQKLLEQGEQIFWAEVAILANESAKAESLIRIDFENQEDIEKAYCQLTLAGQNFVSKVFALKTLKAEMKNYKI
jgi:hypothetical protein